MRILKILLVFVSIYFIKRFIHLYQLMKKIQKNHEHNFSKGTVSPTSQEKDTVNAQFRVLD